MRRRDSRDEESVSFNKLVERMTDWVASSPDSDSLHHTGVPQLTTAQSSVKHLRKYQRIYDLI